MITSSATSQNWGEKNTEEHASSSPAHQNMTMGGRVKDVYMNGNYVCVHGKDIHAWMKHDELTIQTH
jgi:hypothetical protein